MKFSSEVSIKILECAAQREKETRDFYKECLEKATIPGTKEILRGLVDDEERHYTIIIELLHEAKAAGSIKKIEKSETPDAKTRIEKAFSHKLVNDTDFSIESATINEMLKKALDNEKESFENYLSAAHDTEKAEAKAVFEFLAKEENKHYIVIDNLISYLDNHGNWLYEEENLIFRRG